MEQRRKTVREVLIASRSVADCGLWVVAVGIYRDKVLLNFDPYLRPPDMNLNLKNFPFLNLVKRTSAHLTSKRDSSSLLIFFFVSYKTGNI